MNGAAMVEAPSTTALYVRALYDYHADDRTSLSFRQGDTIQVLTQLASGWWDGVINGVRGWFPSNYCVVVVGPDDQQQQQHSVYQQHLTNGIGSGADGSNTTNTSSTTPGESGTEDEYEEYEDDGTGIPPPSLPSQPQLPLQQLPPQSQPTIDGRLTTEDASRHDQEEAAFWIPQVTPEGRLFYFNTLTGVSKVELPVETPVPGSEAAAANSKLQHHATNTSEHGSSSKPPPEMMASGRFFERNEDETDEIESASEVDESHHHVHGGSHLRRRISCTISDGVSPAASQESFQTPYSSASTRGGGTGATTTTYANQHPYTANVHGMAGTAPLTMHNAATGFTSSALNQMAAGGATIPQNFTDDGTTTPVTWNKLVESLQRSVEAYRQAINNADRSEYVRRAEDISDHLRMLLAAASGTTDNHSGNPSIISTNKALYPHFRDMMSRFSKLVLSSHIAAADFPAADAYSKCLQEAEGVLHGVYGFVEVARAQCGEDIQRLVPGFVQGSANGGSWQSNGLNAKDSLAASSSFVVEQDEYDAFNEPVVPLEASLLARMDELKRMIVVNIRRLEDHLTVREKLVTPFRHEQIGNNVCQAASGILSVFRPWISTVESIDLAPFASTFQVNQLLEFSSHKQRLYDLIAQLVLNCQYAAAPLGDEWAENRGDPLEDRLNDVRSTLRSLEACISQIGHHLQLLIDMIPREAEDVEGSDGGASSNDLRRYRTTGAEMYTGGTSSSASSISASATAGGHVASGVRAGSESAYPGGAPPKLGSMSRPKLSDMNFPASYSEGLEPGGEHYRHRQQDNSKVKKFFGEVPADIEEEPPFLRLDYEKEISYDTKTEPPQLRGGTLIALVEQLTRHDKLDSHFNNTFLLTYRSFTTANELFDMLVQRFDIQPPAGLSAQDYNIWIDKKRKPIRFRVVNILKSWFDNFWMEENNEASNEMLRRVFVFAKDHVATTATPGSTPLMASVERRMRGQEVQAKSLVPTQATSIPAPIMPKNMKKLKFLDIDATEFARQLTIIESRLYGRIKATECLNKQWQKKIASPDDKDPAPNVKALILHSNQLTNWVAEMILNQSDARKRVVVIKHFVAVADKCRALNNYSTLTSIISALGTAPIHRLQRTWSQVNARTLNVLESMRKLMSSSKNFNEYRETLRGANPPCIPFFGIFLTDLTFIEDGIPSIIKRTNLINFAKRAKTAEVIRDIQTFQNVAYPLKAVPDLQDYILSNMQAAGDVHEMYDKSLMVEPREREDEKITRLLSESGFL